MYIDLRRNYIKEVSVQYLVLMLYTVNAKDRTLRTLFIKS